MSQHRKWAPSSALFFNATQPPQPISRQRVTTKSTPKSLVGVRSALLQALNFGSGSVLAIVQRMADATGGALHFQSEDIHWKLREMEREGLVEGFRAPNSHPHQRSPRCYRLTGCGSQQADKERQAIAGLFGLLSPVDASSAH